MIPITQIVVTDKQSDFIQMMSDMVVGDEKGDWYHIPFWFKKVHDRIYMVYKYEEIPYGVRKTIEKLLEPIPDATNIKQ